MDPKAQNKYYSRKFFLEVPYPYTFEHPYSTKESEIFYVSETLWAGGFPWSIICQYDRLDGTAPPQFIACIRSMKLSARDSSGWFCQVSTELYISSPLRSSCVPDIKLFFKDQKFSSRARSHEDSEYMKRFPPIEFGKLPPYVKDGYLTIEVFITVDWKNVKGISAMSDFQSMKISSKDNEKIEEKEQWHKTIRELEAKLIDKDREIATIKAGHVKEMEHIKFELNEARVRMSLTHMAKDHIIDAMKRVTHQQHRINNNVITMSTCKSSETNISDTNLLGEFDIDSSYLNNG